MVPAARASRGVPLLVPAAVFAVLLATLGFAIAKSERDARRALEERFALRSGLATRFIESFVSDLELREREAARDLLGDARPSRSAFRQVVERFGFEAAVLLDRRGRALHVWPHDAEVVGRDLAARYDHLRTAIEGTPARSGVVPSAARREPIVAFAVPYETRFGRRVFSGAFSLAHTPLAAYLRNALPIRGGDLYLVDATGNVIASNRDLERASATLAGEDAGLAESIERAPEGAYSTPDGERYFASEQVGTGWRMVISAPKDALFEPIGGLATWTPWFVLGALAIAAVGVLVALHRLREAKRRLAVQNVRLRELDQVKDEFLATVSHELRTPLTSVVGYLAYLDRGRAGELTPAQRELLEIAARNADRLVHLVDDLLFVAKADAGRLSFDVARIDLADVAREAVEMALPAARDKGVDLVLEAAPIELVGDRHRLAQLAGNLLSNAIKFTPAGGRVTIRAYRARGRAFLEVADTGIGIPAAERDRLFEPFFRASSATDLEIPGTGLGLAVVKTIVEAHGGTIRCASEHATGTTFRVDLPLATPETVAA